MQPSLDAELAAVERARLASLVDGDIDRARALHAAEYELITPGGATLSRDAYLGSIADGTLRYHRFEPVSEVRTRVRGETAIVRYLCAIEIDWPGGHEVGEYWHTDYYERRDGAWQVVWSQATRRPTGDRAIPADRT